MTEAARQKREFARQMRDPSLWGVLAGNLFAIYMALAQNWNLSEIMWVYWAQSVIIGVTSYLRMRALKEFSTANLRMNDRPVPETPAAKAQVAKFFALHYGGFHLAYAVFLWQESAPGAAGWEQLTLLLLCALGFAGSHGYSLAHNLRRDFRQRKPNLGTLMFYPYLRILPMHFAILIGAQFAGTDHDWLPLLAFMSIKSLADAGTHMTEHYLFQRPAPEIMTLRD